MKTMGEKIKLLRTSAGLTQEQLAESIGVATKTIQRYETEESRPDTYALARLASYFDVSADYLLGLIGYKNQLEEEYLKIRPDKQCNRFYAHYLQCRNSLSIDEDADYFAISLDNTHNISAQTEWAGWVNSDMTHEIRKIRSVNPHAFISLWKSLCESVMLINSPEDVDTFLIFGGNALVKAEICKKYLPQFCEPFIVRRGTH